MAENDLENWVMPKAEFRTSDGEFLGSSEDANEVVIDGAKKEVIVNDQEEVAEVENTGNSVAASSKSLNSGNPRRSQFYLISIVLIILLLLIIYAALFILPNYLATETGNF